ncbi:MAG: YihY/virulence factor BrkB family protein, partial [Candidatus Binatia bacterium]
MGPAILRLVVRLQTFLHRLWVAVVEEFRNGRVSLQAASLVYTTLLSLVPLIAVVFSVLKAFEVQQAIEPLLARALEPLGPQGGEITRRIIEFVSNLRVGVLGALGVAGLFYTVFSLIGQIEDALNYIWRVRRSRSLARKFSDYFSVVLVGPVLVFTVLALTASAQSYWLMQRLLQFESIGFVVTLVTRVMPFVFLCITFTALYKLVPHTQVRLSSALVGGVTTGILWQLVGAGFTAFIANSANYTAIYSSFAILIIFLIWLYVGWLIILIGGKVAYVYQYPLTYLAGGPWGRHGYVFRAWLALSALTEITRRHLAGEPPSRLAELASALNVAVTNLEELIDDFIRRGFLFRTTEPEGIVPG